MICDCCRQFLSLHRDYCSISSWLEHNKTSTPSLPGMREYNKLGLNCFLIPDLIQLTNVLISYNSFFFFCKFVTNRIVFQEKQLTLLLHFFFCRQTNSFLFDFFCRWFLVLSVINHSSVQGAYSSYEVLVTLGNDF